MPKSIITTPKEDLKRLRNCWRSMISRCHDPADPAYKGYGGRGISVDEEWRQSFDAFYAYVGRRPAAGYSLDRWPDPNGGYRPGNVRWANQREQIHNRRDNVKIQYGGRERCLAEVCHELGFSHNVAKSRRSKGWLDEDLFKPVGKQGRKSGRKNL